MINVALVSAWHVHAGEYLNRFQNNPNTQVVAMWDEDPARGKEWSENNGLKFYENYDEMMADDNIDAVIVTSPTNMHPELLIKAANAGKHIFTEKVLAIDPVDARNIADAVKKAGVKFAISFPHKTEANFIAVKKLVDSGELGKIVYAKFRKAHTGSVDNWLPDFFYDKEQCGGGAMIDLGAHPMYLLPWYLGKPLRVSSSFTNVTDRPVEDNAVSLIEFEDGVIGVSETGFDSWGNPLVLELSGTDGWLLLTDNDVKYISRKSDGWKVPEFDECTKSPVECFVDSIVNGTDCELLSIDEAVALTDLMAAAYKSASSGKKEDV